MKFSIFLLLFAFVFASCNQDSLVFSDSKKEIRNNHAEIENRSSIDDCAAFLERFIPDTKEEIELIDGLEKSSQLSKNQLEILAKLYEFESPEDFEAYLKEYAKLDCISRNEAKLPSGDICADQFNDCIMDIHASYLLAMADIYFWNALTALHDFMNDLFECTITYLKCEIGN